MVGGREGKEKGDLNVFFIQLTKVVPKESFSCSFFFCLMNESFSWSIDKI